MVYAPALFGWVIFAPSFRFANWFYDRYAFPAPSLGVWRFMGVFATDEAIVYDYQSEAP